MPRLCFRTRVALALLLLALGAKGASAQSMLVTVPELAGMLDDPSVVVLHVADRVGVFEEAHIPGARFIRYADVAVPGADNIGSELPSADVVKDVFEAAGVSDHTRVVLYAQSPVLAARVFFTLDVFGHTKLALLDGGLRAWRDGKQPVQTGAPATGPRGAFTPRLNPHRIADAAHIQTQMQTKAIALLDVRPDDEYFGSNTMGGAHAPGHIAGARQLTWNSLVGADGRFLPRADLKQRLEAAGASATRPAVAYCMVGMRASVVYFVARYLGYDARLYDGSIVDWSRRGLPVTKEPGA